MAAATVGNTYEQQDGGRIAQGGQHPQWSQQVIKEEWNMASARSKIQSDWEIHMRRVDAYMVWVKGGYKELDNVLELINGTLSNKVVPKIGYQAQELVAFRAAQEKMKEQRSALDVVHMSAEDVAGSGDNMAMLKEPEFDGFLLSEVERLNGIFQMVTDICNCFDNTGKRLMALLNMLQQRNVKEVPALSCACDELVQRFETKIIQGLGGLAKILARVWSFVSTTVKLDPEKEAELSRNVATFEGITNFFLKLGCEGDPDGCFSSP